MKSIVIHKNLLYLRNVISMFFLFGLCSFSTQGNAQKKYTIVIDAGHGGKDPGNLGKKGSGYREKDIVLKVAKATGNYLKKESDLKIIFTREKDVFVDLWKRGAIANEAKADLFVSIHCDSHTSNAYGAGTFVLGLNGNKQNLEIAKRENASILLEDNYKERYEGFDPNSAESVIGLSLLQEENLDKSLEIASLIQQNFTRQLRRRDRKVKQDNFQVLRETIMPSVLVELGFLTNVNEGRYLNSKKGQQQMGKAIAEAVINYVNRLKLNTLETSLNTVNNKKDFVIYKVQIASGANKIPLKSYNFKGLKNVTIVKVGNFYKYYYNETEDYKSVEKALQLVKKKGYSSAFIVAFKNGEKISVTEARKMK